MKQQMITRVYAPGTDRSAMWANFHGVVYYPTFIVPLKNGIEATYTFNKKEKPTMSIQLPDPIADVKVAIVNNIVLVRLRTPLSEAIANVVFSTYDNVEGLNFSWVKNGDFKIVCHFYDPIEVAETLAAYFENDCGFKVQRFSGDIAHQQLTKRFTDIPCGDTNVYVPVQSDDDSVVYFTVDQ